MAVDLHHIYFQIQYNSRCCMHAQAINAWCDNVSVSSEVSSKEMGLFPT